MGERQRAVAHVDVIERIAHPCRLNLRTANLGVRKRLLERLDDQILRTLAPVLSKRRAAHANDCDLVFDSASHRSVSEPGALRGRRLPEIGAEASPRVARFDA